MNDYLWDKTGVDTEIEELERSLGVFRSTASRPPRIAPEAPSNSSRLLKVAFPFKFAFAGAGALALLIAAGLAFLAFSSEPRSVSVSYAEPAVDVAPVQIPDAVPSNNTIDVSTVTGRVAVRKSPESRRRALSKPVPVRAITARTSSEPSEDQFASLSAEERHAYDQLMLALSITSSRLKMVQDIADGHPGDLPAAADRSSRSN